MSAPDESPSFGVCYYPEHWPRARWAEDARMMADLGLSHVRIAEFAWSRLEPRDGKLTFDWLDNAVNTLSAAGLRVVIGTPTATPPKWLVDKHPEILPVDPVAGQVRGFGSRRHYDFSSGAYLEEALRITDEMAQRYGQHDGVVGWQTDNEFCCHDTAHSASPAARIGFRRWCASRYASIDELNAAWGNVFWSMEYRNFSEIELPFGAVTETNPAHRLAYRRYASEQVVEFHRRMVDTIRRHAPGKFITHNFIPPAHTGVDNFALAAPLDFPSYDNYPLGRSDLKFSSMPAEEFRRYMRTGHPDFASYDLDQIRGLGNGGFWVMEQQPGPVNWAANNPRPAPGMVRLWTLAAFAHGADCVSYFRWRQVPFAQEQMHAGLLRPDGTQAGGWAEIERAIHDLDTLGLQQQDKRCAPVAIVTSTEAYWVSDIERQSAAYCYDDVQFDYYRALRSLGLSVDFVPPDASFEDYALVIVPCLPIVDEAFVSRCEASTAAFVFGPRTGSKTHEFAIPPTLPPGALQRLMPVRVLSVETLRPDCVEPLGFDGQTYASTIWREEVDAPNADVLATYEDGGPALLRYSRFHYLATLTDVAFLRDLFRRLCKERGIAVFDLDADVRLEQRGGLIFAFNYADEARGFEPAGDVERILGETPIAARDVTVWRRRGTV